MAIFQRSRLNLAYWFALSMGSILVAFAGAIFYVEAEEQLRSFDKSLYKKGRVIAGRSQYFFSQGEWQVELTDTLVLGPQAPHPPGRTRLCSLVQHQWQTLAICWHSSHWGSLSPDERFRHHHLESGAGISAAPSGNHSRAARRRTYCLSPNRHSHCSPPGYPRSRLAVSGLGSSSNSRHHRDCGLVLGRNGHATHTGCLPTATTIYRRCLSRAAGTPSRHAQ